MPIALAVNGVKFEVPCSVDPTLSLHEYLRVNTPFKVFCRTFACSAQPLLSLRRCAIQSHLNMTALLSFKSSLPLQNAAAECFARVALALGLQARLRRRRLRRVRCGDNPRGLYNRQESQTALGRLLPLPVACC